MLNLVFEYRRCQRPDGTIYGTSGQCKKGVEIGAKEVKTLSKPARKGTKEKRAEALEKAKELRDTIAVKEGRLTSLENDDGDRVAKLDRLTKAAKNPNLDNESLVEAKRKVAFQKRLIKAAEKEKERLRNELVVDRAALKKYEKAAQPPAKNTKVKNKDPRTAEIDERIKALESNKKELLEELKGKNIRTSLRAALEMQIKEIESMQARLEDRKTSMLKEGEK